MSLQMAALVPHPPLLVPQIGKDKLDQVQSTDHAMKEWARRIHELDPQSLIMVTPHGPVRERSLGLLEQSVYAEFKGFKLGYHIAVDGPLAAAVATELGRDGYSVTPWPAFDVGRAYFSTGLDHALMVPLYYLRACGVDVPLVALSICALDHQEHFRMGLAIQRAIASTDRKVGFIASGDLSHRLIPTAPAGYDPIGRTFDSTIVDSLQALDSSRVLGLDEMLIERAGECGLRPLSMMLGVVEGASAAAELLSYEGPFGVGYCVLFVQVPATSAAPTRA